MLPLPPKKTNTHSPSRAPRGALPLSGLTNFDRKLQLFENGLKKTKGVRGWKMEKKETARRRPRITFRSRAPLQQRWPRERAMKRRGNHGVGSEDTANTEKRSRAR